MEWICEISFVVWKWKSYLKLLQFVGKLVISAILHFTDMEFLVEWSDVTDCDWLLFVISTARFIHCCFCFSDVPCIFKLWTRICIIFICGVFYFVIFLVEWRPVWLILLQVVRMRLGGMVSGVYWITCSRSDMFWFTWSLDDMLPSLSFSPFILKFSYDCTVTVSDVFCSLQWEIICKKFWGL